jgi:uncharacterized protein YdeI (YjbR/CyaY-like superfamily)
MEDNLPVILFKTEKLWANWLENNIDIPGVWMRIAKKRSGLTSINYQEALDIALCYGWIDGLKKKYDEQSFIQRFTPRRPKSKWSKINKDKVLQFIDEGKMKPSGMATIEDAKKSGAWDNVFDPYSTIEIPEDFQKLLADNKNAEAYFNTMNKRMQNTILNHIQSAKKAETRENRMKKVIGMFNKGELNFT